MNFLRRASRCRIFGSSVAEGGARCWTFLERALFRACERDLVVKTGSDLDTIAGRQVNVDRVWDRLQLSMTKGPRVCLHRFHGAGGRNHGVSTDQRRGVACVGRETSAVQCNHVTGMAIAYREKQTRQVLVDHAQVICRIGRTPCPMGECNPRS